MSLTTQESGFRPELLYPERDTQYNAPARSKLRFSAFSTAPDRRVEAYRFKDLAWRQTTAARDLRRGLAKLRR